MLGFGTMLLVAWTLLHLYVFGRAWTVPVVRRRVPRAVYLAGAAALWTSFAVPRLFFHNAGGRAGAALELFGLSALTALFLAGVALLAVDLATLFGFLFTRYAPALRGWALVVGGVLSALALVQGMRPPGVVRHEVRLADLPAALDGTVVVALSDTHLGSLLDGSWLAARAAQIEAERPDLIVLLGDLVEGHGEEESRLLRALGSLRAPLGVYAVAGNHERHRGNGTSLRALEDSGVRVLRDQWIEAAPGLVVAGVEDLTTRRRRSGTGGGDPIGTALAGRPTGAVVLLSHTPWDVERADRAGAGLMLSGHTHGGQVWPFGYVVRLRYPFLAGRYETGGLTLIVSRGAGTWGPRMRLWRRGEILRVTLRRA